MMPISSTLFRQRGAVLFVALVMLAVLTILAASNIRNVSLESRITANRIEYAQLKDLADAALREGEFRLFGDMYLEDKLEPNLDNCQKNNRLNIYGNNRPCLLTNMDVDHRARYYRDPLGFFTDAQNATYANDYAAKTGAAAIAASDNAVVAWMPYRGLSADTNHVYEPRTRNGVEENAFWNVYLLPEGSEGTDAAGDVINPEYPSVLTGKGIHTYLVTGQAMDKVAVQSTISVFYTGL